MTSKVDQLSYLHTSSLSIKLSYRLLMVRLVVDGDKNKHRKPCDGNRESSRATNVSGAETIDAVRPTAGNYERDKMVQFPDAPNLLESDSHLN